MLKLTNQRAGKVLMTLSIPSFLLLFLKLKEESPPRCDFLLLWVTLHFCSPLKNTQVLSKHAHIHINLLYITFPKLYWYDGKPDLLEGHEQG